MACSCARAATLSGIAAARHGLHVLVERPIDISPGRADALIAAAERAGVLCGNVAPVNARTATALHRIEAEDLALALLEFENGALGVLEITGTGGTVIVAGDRIVAADLKNPVSLPPAEPADQNPSTDSPIVSDVRGHASVIADFMAAIRNHTAPRCDGREGRRSVALVEAIYAAARAAS